MGRERSRRVLALTSFHSQPARKSAFTPSALLKLIIEFLRFGFEALGAREQKRWGSPALPLLRIARRFSRFLAEFVRIAAEPTHLLVHRPPTGAPVGLEVP